VVSLREPIEIRGVRVTHEDVCRLPPTLDDMPPPAVSVAYFWIHDIPGSELRPSPQERLSAGPLELAHVARTSFRSTPIPSISISTTSPS
jgi:hypothetical protein